MNGSQILNDNELAVSPSEKIVLQINNKRIRFLSFLISLSGLIVGFEVGTADNLINGRDFTQNFGMLNNDLLIGFIMGSFNLGCIIGSLFVLFLKNFKYNHILYLSYLIYYVGILVNVVNWAANYRSITLLIIYRLICGISGGISLLVCPIYIAKLNLDDSKRGSNLSFFQLNLCSGILFGNLLNLFLNPFVIQPILNAIILVISITNFWLLPPIISQEARFENIQKFFFNLVDVNQLETTKEVVSKFKWKKLVICMSLMVFQQLTGINFFFYYSNQLFPNNLLVLVMSIINLLGSLITFKIIGLFNRLTILAFGSIGIISMLILFYTLQHFIIIYFIVLIFAISWGPVSGIIVNEIANFNFVILTISIVSNFLTNFLILNLTPAIMSMISFNILFIFIISSLFSLTLIFYIPETKNLSLAQIEKLFL